MDLDKKQETEIIINNVEEAIRTAIKDTKFSTVVNYSITMALYEGEDFCYKNFVMKLHP